MHVKLSMDQFLDILIATEMRACSGDKYCEITLHFGKPIKMRGKLWDQITISKEAEGPLWISLVHYVKEGEAPDVKELDLKTVEDILENHTFRYVEILGAEKKFKTWYELLEFLDIGDLVTLCTKVPNAVADQFEKYAHRNNETISSQLRKLMLGWLKIQFEEDAKSLISTPK